MCERRKRTMPRHEGSLRCKCLALAYLQAEEAAATIVHTVGQTVLDTARTMAGRTQQRRRIRH